MNVARAGGSQRTIRPGNAAAASSVTVPMRVLTTATLLGALLPGCIASQEAEDLVLVDEREAMPELHAIPYAELPEGVAPAADEAPETEPEIEPSARASSRPRFVAAAPGPDACWGVAAEGFPAISDDGATVVVPRSQHLQLSYVPGTMDLEWHDVATGRVDERQPIVEGDRAFDENDSRACSRAARGIRRRAHAANAALDAVPWRAMERLPVAVLDPYATDETRAEHLAAVPPQDRVVQLVVRHGEAVLRIPGVQVLERHPVDARGEAFAAYGDRVTGTVVLVTAACAGDSCTCDPSFTAHVLRWSPETFATIDARPCIPVAEDARAAEDALADDLGLAVEDARDVWTSCAPLEHELAGPPWVFG